MNSHYASIAATIQDLVRELSKRRAAQSDKIPEQHNGAKYKIALLSFAERANRLENEFSARVHRVADDITSLASEGWPNDVGVITLWHQLASAVTNCSEHPTKPVASLIISKENKLLAFGVNRVPRGIKKLPRYYKAGDRKNYIVCSERIAIGKFLNVKVRNWPMRKSKLSKTAHDIFVRQQIAHFSTELTDIKHAKELRDSRIIVTNHPCTQCAEVIAALRPKAIYYGKGISMKRQDTFKHSAQLIRAKDIGLIYLHT